MGDSICCSILPQSTELAPNNSLMQLHLFGAATPTGAAFRKFALSAPNEWSLKTYSRKPDIREDTSAWADFSDPAGFVPSGDCTKPSIWISFGPIWLLAPFLEDLARKYPERLNGVQGLIACSSSSAITKRFAANRFDRDLSARLISAEDQLLNTCHNKDIHCHIMRPTLIYGQVDAFCDKNLSRLLLHMRRWPILPLPAATGLRQPIHSRQLATYAFIIAQQIKDYGSNTSLPDRISLGGDTILSYTAMLKALQDAQKSDDPARRCRLIPVPNRLFFAVASPLLLISPKAFEAVLRMGSDLAGFCLAHQLTGEPEQPFPLP